MSRGPDAPGAAPTVHNFGSDVGGGSGRLRAWPRKRSRNSSRRRRSNVPSEPVDRMLSSKLIDTKPSARVPDIAEHSGPYAVPLDLYLEAARSVEEISSDHSHSNARRLADSLGEAIRHLVD